MPVAFSQGLRGTLPSPHRIKPWAMGALGLRLREIGVTPGRIMSTQEGHIYSSRHVPAWSDQSRMRGSDLAPGGSFPMMRPQTHALGIPCFPDRQGTLALSLLRECECGSLRPSGRCHSASFLAHASPQQGSVPPSHRYVPTGTASVPRMLL